MSISLFNYISINENSSHYLTISTSSCMSISLLTRSPKMKIHLINILSHTSTIYYQYHLL